MLVNVPITSLLSAATTSPTPNESVSYATYQKVGNHVWVQFKYVVATVGTGAIRLNLPVPINASHTKPQGFFTIRYVTTGPGLVHQGYYNENTASIVNLVVSTTFGAAPTNLTQSSPHAMVIGDVISGEISYEC